MSAIATAERPRLVEARVERSTPFSRETFVLEALVEDVEFRLQPGEFLQARAWSGGDPLLRRPLAPLDVRLEGTGTRVELLIQKVGRGTRAFGALRPGDGLSLLGPLGKGFAPLPEGDVVAVAGGVGVAPIHHLARESAAAGRARDWTVVIGARERRLLFGVERFAALGLRLVLATDLGDAGIEGTAVDALERTLAEGSRPAIVLGCGPEPMLESLVAVLRREGLRGEVSLERRMACGFGVCMTCVARLLDPATGRHENLRTCLDGPVVDISRLSADGW